MILHELIKRTHRVPILQDVPGDAEQVTRQLDVALMSVGFKLSKDFLTHYSQQQPSQVELMGHIMLAAVRELVGDSVQHNTYFIDFPKNVPNTLEFWWTELYRVFFTGETRYGQYQHTYQEMLTHHDDFLSSVTDRVTVLHLGASLQEEISTLYRQLVTSTVPLNDADRTLLKELAVLCVNDEQPDIPVRETKAIVNAVRVQHNKLLFADTITDVLRLACALSDGDVTLQTNTKFKSFPRHIRRTLLLSLEDILEQHPAQRGDIHQYREEWKRLGEYLHMHEDEQRFPHAAELDHIAHGEVRVPSFAFHVEQAFLAKDVARVLNLLEKKPGVFIRTVDRILRTLEGQDDLLLVKTLEKTIPAVSGRVLLGLIEHLQNRNTQRVGRIFTNSKGRAWATADTLLPLDAVQTVYLCSVIDDEMMRRLPHVEHLVIDPGVLQVALPLSEKSTASGFTVYPRGSVISVSSDILRFFVYWKQKEQRTDYDLSVMFLDKEFQTTGHVSWTRLKTYVSKHSGDLTEAKNGASEFIDVQLSLVDASYIVPVVYIFAGEDFKDVETCFFGLMERNLEQKGKPFEPKTVRYKSDIRGSGKVAMPVLFAKDEDGRWSAKWMHLYGKGQPRFNRIETNKVSTGLLAKMIMERDYLTVEHLAILLMAKADRTLFYHQGDAYEHPVTFLGLEQPEGLPKGSSIYTLQNLSGLIPG